MKNSTNLLFAVIHPLCQNYFLKYLHSVNNQTFQDFEILIINDNSTSPIPKANRIITIDVSNKNLTPAQIRQVGINYAIENKYQNLFFSDIDDYFSENRIEQSFNKLKHYDIVFNNLTLVDENENIIEHNFLSKLLGSKKVNSIFDIIDYNLIGLSNSAINIEKLQLIEIPKNIIAVDWWLYSILLIKNYSTFFIDNAITYYRQHDLNTVGMKIENNIKTIINKFDVKLIHYNNMSNFCKTNNISNLFDLYEKKIFEVQFTINKLKESETYFDKYLSIISENYSKIYKGWWSDAITYNELKQYEPSHD